MIFLVFRFYVKSVLENSDVQKLQFRQVYRLWFLILVNSSPQQIAKIIKPKIQRFKYFQTCSLDVSNSIKLISRKISFHFTVWNKIKFTLAGWNFSKFSATLILREINFGWCQRVKNCHFIHFGGFEFWIFGNFINENVRNSQKFKILRY